MMCGFKDGQSEIEITYIVAMYSRKRWIWKGEFEEIEDALQRKRDLEKCKSQRKFGLFEKIKGEVITEIRV